MAKGLIIYSVEDVEKNRKFIKMCTENLGADNINLELKVIENENWEKIFQEVNSDELSFAINRSRNHKLSKTLENMGVRVFNNSQVTEIGNDKWKTYELAKKLDIPVMYTERNVDCKKISYPKVIKSCKGHGGSEVFLVRNDAERDTALGIISGECILQDYANAGGKDKRVYVVGGQCAIAMCRQAKQGFKSNYGIGAHARQCELKEKEKEIVDKICREIMPDYIGIDFIYDGDEIILNEIEDAVGAKMVYENTDVNIVEQFTNYVKTKL